MGIAEITPGISGATIAGLFNVYKDFVKFLNVFNTFKINISGLPQTPYTVKKRKPINGTFSLFE